MVTRPQKRKLAEKGIKKMYKHGASQHEKHSDAAYVGVGHGHGRGNCVVGVLLLQSWSWLW